MPVVLVAAFLHLSIIALAAAPATGLGLNSKHRAPAVPQSANDQGPTMSLPPGSQLCPASGVGAACDTSVPATASPGQSSLPDGLTQCPADPAKPELSSPAACDDTTLPFPASPAAGSTEPTQAPVLPSVPQPSLGATGAPESTGLTLFADRSSPRAGESVLLTATATATVTGTASAIEIFDKTTSTLAGICMQSSRCRVGYSANSGVHSFVAFITRPAATVPAAGEGIASNPIQVSWFGVTLKSDQPSVVGPGKPVKLTAATSVDVGAIGHVLMFWDTTAGRMLTFCSSGTTCATQLSEPAAGSHAIVAFVGTSASATISSGLIAASDKVSAKWLAVSLSASATDMQAGSVVHLSALSNVDLTNTPWSIAIYDQTGHVLGQSCKTGYSCDTQATLTNGPTPSFFAAIGATPPLASLSTPAGQLLQNFPQSAPLINIQVKSPAVQPSRLLWGVDSCKPITAAKDGWEGLYAEVHRGYGAPDFWGRYLTTTYNCPGLTSTEVDAASARHFGILPIYNDYDCSAVSGYGTGQSYGVTAAAAAADLRIPKGTVLVIDIEPPGAWCSGAVDAAFIEGWYDGVSGAGYAPGYYGDGTSWSTFGSAWCAAVADRPEVAFGSYLWSFEPSLLGSYTKATAPGFSPNQVGCAGNMAAWQYVLSTGSTPDVDSDEALSKLPLWYP